jgi:hypothetical protein
MALQQILAHIRQAEKELAEMVTKEQQQQTGQKMMYTFVYEQRYDDAPGWGPNQQYIEATSVGQAFATLGFLIDEMKLTIRNVRYGTQDEMQDETLRISQYWNVYHKQKH